MSLVTCHLVGDALVRWLRRATPEQREALCQALNCPANIDDNEIIKLINEHAKVVTKDTSTVAHTGDGREATPLESNVRVSSNAQNMLTITADGLLVLPTNVPAADLTTEDTTTIDLTGNGSTGMPLKADARIDPAPGNLLKAGPGGLRVDGTATTPAPGTTAVEVADTTSVNLEGNGTTATPITATVRVDGAPGNLLTDGPNGLRVELGTQPPGTFAVAAEDTATLDVTGDGTTANPIKGDVKLSQDADNQIEARADGLYVPRGTGGGTPGLTAVAVEDTETLDMSGDGTAGSPIKGDVKVSADPGNIISAHADGLFAQAPQQGSTAIAVEDSSTVDLQGNGTTADPLKAVARVSAEQGNIIFTKDDGLYAASGGTPLPGTVAISVEDTDTVDLQGDGTEASKLTATVKLSQDAGNKIAARGDGLFVAASEPVAVGDTATLSMEGDGTAGTPVKGTVKVSGGQGNQITVKQDGLHVDLPGKGTVGIAAQDTDTVDIEGDGTTASPVQATVKLSQVAGNQITANDDGLHVALPAQGSVAMAVDDTNTIDIRGVGTNDQPLVADVKLAPGGNAITAKAEGLHVELLSAIDTATLDVTGTGTEADPLKGDVKVSSQGGNILQTRDDGLFVPASGATPDTGLKDSSDVIVVGGAPADPGQPPAAKVLLDAVPYAASRNNLDDGYRFGQFDETAIVRTEGNFANPSGLVSSPWGLQGPRIYNPPVLFDEPDADASMMPVNIVGGRASNQYTMELVSNGVMHKPFPNIWHVQGCHHGFIIYDGSVKVVKGSVNHIDKFGKVIKTYYKTESIDHYNNPNEGEHILLAVEDGTEVQVQGRRVFNTGVRLGKVYGMAESFSSSVMSYVDILSDVFKKDGAPQTIHLGNQADHWSGLNFMHACIAESVMDGMFEGVTFNYQEPGSRTGRYWVRMYNPYLRPAPNMFKNMVLATPHKHFPVIVEHFDTTWCREDDLRGMFNGVDFTNLEQPLDLSAWNVEHIKTEPEDFGPSHPKLIKPIWGTRGRPRRFEFTPFITKD